jgi:spore maturation protein SpmA
MVWLFPEIPPDHPAMGAIILNMAANALGLGNAATPFGLKAIRLCSPSVNGGDDSAWRGRRNQPPRNARDTSCSA